MPSDDLSKVRQELLQMKRELENEQQGIRPDAGEAGGRTKPRFYPLMDFGLFLLSYFFWLIVIVTLEVTAGIGIHPYTCFFAVPFAWLTVAWVRKAGTYALLVSVCGVLFLAGAAYLVSGLFDMAWDSNCYHKPLTGMLALGWNPFEQTMIDFANTHDYLPYNSGWLPFQVNNQPKASFMIGASLYAFTGGIAYGKIFNLVSLVACVCIAAPLLRDAFRLSLPAALLCMVLACANLITISQIALYYNDGFTYQMLTVAAVSFAYLLFKPRGKHALAAKAAAFLAICIAVNVKTSAALYAAILSLVYFGARAIALSRPENRKKRAVEIRSMIQYFAAMVFCAGCVLGATTYILNLVRYGNPLYGMLGESSMNSLLAALMGPKIHALPLVAQFFVSMFSPTSNSLFTDVNLKLPFTFSNEEWALATHDANVSGWGILFGGIFLASVAIILVTAVRMRRHSRRAYRLLLGVLATVILPAFVIPYLFSARYYLQPFWIPLAALVCLFAPSVRIKQTGKPRYPRFRFLKFALAPVLCALLAVNAYTGFNYLAEQSAQTRESRETIAAVKARLAQGDTAMDVSTISRGLFYGLLFNLQDEGVGYNFCETLPATDGSALKYLIYDLRERGPEADAAANSFLYSLYRNGYLVVIAANSGGPLTDRMAGMLGTIGLMRGGQGDPVNGYLAVVDPQGAVLLEKGEFGDFNADVGGIPVQIRCTPTILTVGIGGEEFVRGGDGYNIVVYDTVNRLAVASVAINPQSSPVMTAQPVRLAGGAAP